MYKAQRDVSERALEGADELQTVIIEIENVLNSRPLTYLYPDEMDEALTPSHLICGRRLLTLPSEFHMSARIVNSEEQESTTNSQGEQNISLHCQIIIAKNGESII